MRLSTITVLVAAASAQLAVAANNPPEKNRIREQAIETTIVTATRESQNLQDVALSAGVIDKQTIEFLAPSHPSELLSRVAGVHINNLGGDGHMTSIRQPLSTAGVYLFLEDGIPTRPTGFFNHNGLYEVDMVQSDRIEVIKGPGSALYGSDAIAGVINNITEAPAADDNRITLEGGDYDWMRGLASISDTFVNNAGGDSGYRVNLLASHNSGYRDNSGSERQTGTFRFDTRISDINIKNILSVTNVDQSGAGALNRNDYKNNPETNYYENSIGMRKVDAVRVSSEWNWDIDSAQAITITPFYRYNSMELMPSWLISVPAQSYISDTDFETYGLLAKWRYEFSDSSLLIAGVDIDDSPASYVEDNIDFYSPDGNAINTFFKPYGTIYSSYQKTGVTPYDFDATQSNLSPYIHSEWQVLPALRLTGGVRHDFFRIDYDNNLSTVTTTGFGLPPIRPESQVVEFEQTSPKVGAIFDLSDDVAIFANYLKAFRAPGVSNLFRSGNNTNSSDLQPVIATNTELGIRGEIIDSWYGSASVYKLEKEDDIISQKQADGSFNSVNASETEHKGVELEIEGKLTDSIDFGASWTWTHQEYKKYQTFIRQGFATIDVDYSGNTINLAPNEIGNVRLGWTPPSLQALKVEWEMEKLGDYYTNETNTLDYSGYVISHLRANYKISDDFDVYARVFNLQDKLYSVYTGANGTVNEYRPGYDRTLYIGARIKF